MANFYIHGTDGSDANAGSLAEPCKTVSGFIAKGTLSDGDTIYIKGGITYPDDTDVIITKHCTIRPYIGDTEKPIFTVETPCSYIWLFSFDTNASVTIIENITFINEMNSSNAHIAITNDKDTIVIVSNCDFIGGGTEDVPGLSRPIGITLGNPSTTDVIRLLVFHCNFYNLSQGVLLYTGKIKSGSVILNCIFQSCGTEKPYYAIRCVYESSTVSQPVFVDHCYLYNNENDYYTTGGATPTILLGIGNLAIHQNDFDDSEAYALMEPGFTDPKNGDLHLSDTSPCIDMGGNMSNPNEEYGDYLIAVGEYYDTTPIDSNRPWGLETRVSDLGSYGGPHNLAGPDEYTLTVVNGSGSGTYEDGTIVSIQSHKEGFIKWIDPLGIVADVYSRSTTATLNGADATVTALVKDFEMTAGVYDFVIEQRSNFVRRFYYKDEDGNAIDVSTWTASLVIKDRVDGTTIDTWTSPGDIDMATNGSDGIIDIDIATVDTAGYDFDWAYYEFYLIKTDVDTDKFLFLTGRVRLDREL